eukprot:1151012-Pelagomonas_calceolata.AAC.2
MAVCLRTLVLFVTFSACLGALRDWCPEQQEASNGFNTTQLQLALSGKKITCGAVVGLQSRILPGQGIAPD